MLKLNSKHLVMAAMLLTSSYMHGASRFQTGSTSITPQQAGSQYLPYPHTDATAPVLTPAPDGYTPFHIEHYARHGSRWIIDESRYTKPVQMLETADRNGKLTERGKLLLEQLRTISKSAAKRDGELTEIGAEQHRGIGRRLARNFPEIFRKGTYVDAKSTVVIRSILSMTNELIEIEKISPDMHVRTDASAATQQWMGNACSSEPVTKRLQKKAAAKIKQMNVNNDHSSFISKVFTDPDFVNDSIGSDKIFKAVFDIASNTQSHTDQPDLYDLFTQDELYNQWLIHNATWFTKVGNSKLTKNRMPYSQRFLLRNIIESADTAMTSPLISANLRFGHDGMVAPMTALMELNGLNVEVNKLDNLAAKWRDYTIIPMACNIQLIFYRPLNSINPDNVLVKILLNETEATLPLTAVSGPYYKWSDVRTMWMNKLDAFPTLFDE